MQIIITDNTATYEGNDDSLESIGDVFDVLDSCNGGWLIKEGRCIIQVAKAEAKVYTTASNHDARADDSEGGCR